MNMKHLGATAALIVVATLAACGGKAMFAVSGTISGLNNPGLVLENGSDKLSVPAGATTFTMPQQISYGQSFDVEVLTQPAHMTCTAVFGNIDSAGHTTNINAEFQCAQNTYTLGGTVNGLTGTGLVLINGSQSTPLTVLTGATSFQFVNPVADGTPYGVTVFTQPTGQTCSVDKNPTGIMGGSPVSNVVVDCVNNPS